MAGISVFCIMLWYKLGDGWYFTALPLDITDLLLLELTQDSQASCKPGAGSESVGDIVYVHHLNCC